MFDRWPFTLAGGRQSVQMQSDEDTLNSILDSLAGFGDFNVFGDDAQGRINMRNAALQYPALARCVTLLSAVIAQLVTGGTLRVLDSEGKVVNDMQAGRAVDLFSNSLDGVFDSHSTVEDLASDYLLDGNHLSGIDQSSNGRVTAIRRLVAHSAQTTPTTSGGIVYQAHFADSGVGEYEFFAPRNVAHGRWPRLFRSSASAEHARRFFAMSPVRLLHPALQIAIAGDGFIRDWYREGQRASFGISFKEKLSTAQLNDLRAAYDKIQNSRRPMLVDKGAQFTNLQNAAANKDQAELREFQVAEISRVYGVPGPLVNQNLTSWGQGIEELAKIFWRFGAAQHVNRFMAPFNFRLLQSGHRFSVDPVDLLRGDSTALANLLNAVRADAQRDAVATVEEQRRMVGLPAEPESGELQTATGGSNDDGQEDQDNGGGPPMPPGRRET